MKRMMRDRYAWPSSTSRLWLMADMELAKLIKAPEWRVHRRRREVRRHTNQSLEDLRLLTECGKNGVDLVKMSGRLGVKPDLNLLRGALSASRLPVPKVQRPKVELRVGCSESVGVGS